MGYDLNGANGDFVCNNYTMHLLVEKMLDTSIYQYEPLWKKFEDNSGRWVNKKWCKVLLKLAIKARDKAKTLEPYSDQETEIPRWDEFIKFLNDEVNGEGGFSVN